MYVLSISCSHATDGDIQQQLVRFMHSAQDHDGGRCARQKRCQTLTLTLTLCWSDLVVVRMLLVMPLYTIAQATRSPALEPSVYMRQ